MLKQTKSTYAEWIVLTLLIGWLGLLFIPLSSTARQHSKATLCLANLHILSRAWLAYAEDNDGHLVNGHVPRSADYANESYWLTTTSFGGPYKDNAWWVNPPHDENGVYTGEYVDGEPCTLQEEENGIRSGKLFPYVGTPAAYHCPASRTYLNKPDIWGNGRSGKRIYAITCLMHGEMPNIPDCVHNFSQIKQPSQKYMFLECTD
ncbi:MAG: hypothetical protein JXA82_09015, partial [Sedimentisphaerales bacterium]|nr:hypothetical protein [Sedimentisphaerales bacterium]